MSQKIWDYSKRFQSIAELWPSGVDGLFLELKNLGFDLKPHFQNMESLGLLNKIRSSSSTNTQNPSTSITYVMGERALIYDPKSWGLVVADKANALSLQDTDAKILETNAPDALLDFLAKAMVCPEWFQGAPDAGPESSQKTKSLNERFPGVFFESPESTVVGPYVQIGEGTIVEGNVRIGARVKIGMSTRIGAQTRIADDCEIGNAVQITGLASIGGQGFGFIKYPKEKVTRQRRHVGRVLIHDRVRLGAFVAIDKGVFEDSLVEQGAALDNFVQVAHNCEVGVENRLCAFVGLSGSTKIGAHVTLGGMVATKGHLKIGEGSIVGGHSGITADLKPGSVVKGYPPRPINEALKIATLQTKLPEIYNRLRALEKIQSRKDPKE